MINQNTNYRAPTLKDKTLPEIELWHIYEMLPKQFQRMLQSSTENFWFGPKVLRKFMFIPEALKRYGTKIHPCDLPGGETKTVKKRGQIYKIPSKPRSLTA